jgi:uncharacterized protein YutE (UPF0331/DUF86 family)
LFNLALIAERLNVIRNAVNRLRLLAEMPAEEFCRSEDAVDIAENRLRRAIEALFDLGRHLVVKSGAGVPPDYRSVIELLRESGMLPGHFAARIEGMAGYRNRIVHDYNKVTPQELYQVLDTRLADFDLFCQYIVDYLEKNK